jgi:GT2 family glycosyltransferase
MKLTIGIPTINRADLLAEALEDIKTMANDLHSLILVDNGNQVIHIPEELVGITHLYRPGTNLGVSGSWNYMLRKAYNEDGTDNVLLLNDDIVFGKSVNEVNTIISNHPNYQTVVGPKHWCTVLVSKRCIETVGYFDEKFFPAYYEDNDYAYRINLLHNADPENYNGLELDLALNPKVFRNSMTIQKDKTLNKHFSENKKYFIKKWGGKPHKETFTKPFNK